VTDRPGIRFEPFGDAAILIVLGNVVDDATTARVQRAAQAVEELRSRDPRFGRPVAAYTTVLVPVDPIDPGVAAATGLIDAWLWPHLEDDGGAVASLRSEPVEIPTRYGGVHGPDLESLAELHDLRPRDVVEIHASVTYRVQFLGFVPGFAYLRTVPASIATARLPSPRVQVPAGSVAIADDQTAIYPFPSPGGWRLIGRTDVRIWDVTADPPALLLPGTRVRFVPLSA
jgi:KipI family sensor histidine kinase inhibitor